MIGKLLVNEAANAALVVVLSGTVATLVARGLGRATFSEALSAVLSNPVPRRVPSDVHGGPRPSAAEGRAAA